ncbi:MAG: acyl-CoA dehydrogenase family protein [Rhodobacteraceae bacterium]|nr:acyl-CoA dehydrogenase family protein [Paracoccaceae bacterium]
MVELRAIPETPELAALRCELRDFLATEITAGRIALRNNSWLRYDAAFSRRCGQRGYVGMRWPRRYGGQERSERERFVVAEEMLAAGAPVGAHWIADRQSGGQILRFGTERARTELLPRIAAGMCFFAIGMSEPDSGSDLASVTTRARKVEGGWRITGRKVWTTNAHNAHYLIALVRTSPPDPANRRAGLTQMIVDLTAPGIEISPIYNISGEREFNEILFEDCPVGDDMVLGEVGSGWACVVNELALERSGPDRYMSAFPLLAELFRAQISDTAMPPGTGSETGRLLAHLIALRSMSHSVAAMLDEGHAPETEAALVKDVGNAFEQAIPESGRRLFPLSPSLPPPEPLAEMLAQVTRDAPSFSLRGGTREVLRGIIARGLGLR